MIPGTFPAHLDALNVLSSFIQNLDIFFNSYISLRKRRSNPSHCNEEMKGMIMIGLWCMIGLFTAVISVMCIFLNLEYGTTNQLSIQ